VEEACVGSQTPRRVSTEQIEMAGNWSSSLSNDPGAHPEEDEIRE